ncbi:MAG: hypothetical protein JO042_06265, partial [Sinobacteraceae bacterium]|nr:hypothetical protein [Nevskiaceae bacterium]
MDIKTPIKLDRSRPARASATGALCGLAAFSIFITQPVAGQTPQPPQIQQAVTLYSRLTGAPPSATDLNTIATDIASGQLEQAAAVGTSAPNFYNVVLRNMFAAESNRAQSVFVPLNDYIVTAIGMVHDNVPYNQALSADILYTLKGVSPAASASDNNHYQAADTNVVDIASNLVKSQQTTTYGYPAAAVAGLITTRAGAIQHFDAGTNRRGYAINIINQTCHAMEDVMDTSLPSDRVRQDVAASPGADSRVRLQSCLGCHSHQDPMAGAFAYYDFNETTGAMVYTPGTVQHKYFINATNNPFGYVTVDDEWENRIRLGGADTLIFNYSP